MPSHYALETVTHSWSQKLCSLTTEALCTSDTKRARFPSFPRYWMHLRLVPCGQKTQLFRGDRGIQCYTATTQTSSKESAVTTSEHMRSHDAFPIPLLSFICASIRLLNGALRYWPYLKQIAIPTCVIWERRAIVEASYRLSWLKFKGGSKLGCTHKY